MPKAWLYVRSEDCPGRAIPLKEETVRVGRDPSCEIVFASIESNTVVSRVHVEIGQTGGEYWVQEAASCLNGTYVDGKRIESRTKLRSGACVQLGQTGPVLIFTVGDEAPAFAPVDTVHEQVPAGPAGPAGRQGTPAKRPRVKLAVSDGPCEPAGAGSPGGSGADERSEGPPTAGCPGRPKGESRRVVTLDGDDLYLGRDPRSDLAFDPHGDRIVSTSHARISFVRGHFHLFDLDSANGTWLKDRHGPGFHRIQGFVPLRHRDVFALGEPARGGKVVTFEEVADDLPAPTPQKPLKTYANLRSEALAIDDLVPVESKQLPSWAAHIGRCPESPLAISDPAVSFRHVALELKDGHWHFLDLESTNGTYRNGQRVRSGVLAEGDILTIGQTAIRFRNGHLDLLRAAATPPVTVRDLHASLPSQGDGLPATALKGLSFCLSPGEFVGLLGASGSGKSLLLDVLAGNVAPSGGSVSMIGIDIFSDPRRAAHVVGHVTGELRGEAELSVREALDYRARLRLPPEMPSGAIVERVDEVIRLVELTDHAGVRIRDLNTAQARRLALAGEIVTRPTILLVDDLARGLDPGSRMSLLSTLRNLSRNRTTILYATHEPDQASMFDRVAVLCGGQLVFLGATDSAMAFFGIGSMDDLPARIEAKPLDHWRSQFDRVRAVVGAPVPAALAREVRRQHDREPHPPGALDLRHLWTSCRIYARELYRSVDSVASHAIGLPVLVGALACLATRSLAQLLLALPILVFWLACAHAASEIVRDRPVFLREHRHGFGSLSFVASRLMALMVIDAARALILTAIVAWYHSWPGTVHVAAPVLFATSVAGTATGLAVGALFWRPTLAARAVPLAVACQVVLSGMLAPHGSEPPGVAVFSTLHFACWALSLLGDEPSRSLLTGLAGQAHGLRGPLAAVVAIIAVQAAMFLWLAAYLVARWPGPGRRALPVATNATNGSPP